MLITFNHVYKSYQAQENTLKDVSLQIQKGSFVFLIGSSGAGKTTLLKHIYMNELPDKGEVSICFDKDTVFNSRNITLTKIQALRSKIGIVFQDFKLFFDRDIFNNIALPLQLKGEKPAIIKDKVYNILAQYSLTHKAKRYPQELSGGEQQRISVARSLIDNPYLIVADEPTGNLDPENSYKIVELFEKANAKGTTVVMATHQLDLVKKSHYPSIKIEDGRIVNRFI